jgi:MFS family permease
MEKKYVLIFSMAGFAALSYGVAVTLTMGWLNKQTWWIIIIFSVGLSILMGLAIPARHAIIPQLVGKESLMNAVSLNAFGMNILRLMAPAAAGFLIHGFGFEAVFYLLGALYTWALVFMLFLPGTGKGAVPPKNVTTPQKSVLQEVKDGFKYLRGKPDIAWILIFSLIAVVLSLTYQRLLPIFVDDILMVGARGMGILISVSGVGAIAGSLILASLPNKNRGLMLLSSTLVLGIAIVTFAFSRSWMLSLSVMVVIGMSQTAMTTLSNTLAQHYSSREFRGRVMGIYDMQMSFPGIAVFIAGILSDSIGVEWTVGGFAMLLVAVSTLFMIKVPRIRRLD